MTNWRQVQLNAAWQRLYSQTDEAMQVSSCSLSLLAQPVEGHGNTPQASVQWQHEVDGLSGTQSGLQLSLQGPRV